MQPPPRADHVGSLLRPPEVLVAHAARARGDATDAEVAEIEDRAVLDALALQREVGLEVFTDGEFRRSGWASGFPAAVSGYVDGEPPLTLRWQLGAQPDASTAVDRSGATRAMVDPLGSARPPGSSAPSYRVIGDRVAARRRIAAHEAVFLQAHAPGRFKVTMPAPSYNVARGWKPGVTDRVYADRAALTADVADIVAAELAALTDAGVTYLQLDNPHLPDYLTEDKRAQWRAIGVDPDRALEEDLAGDNRAIAAVDRSRALVACHICRGNAASAWHATGGYDAIAEKVFGTLDVDRWLLEYDSDRAGGFEPLRFMPRGRTVVLGLVTTKSGELEPADAIVRRIEDASRHISLDQLAVSPQCGFASVESGNLLSGDDQRRKLELVVEVAQRVWG
jgi:5-methyltetrahydropteroyltriglutamate--homocysteine methyltransferase